MVGKNNAGKSTIIEVLRLCSLITKKYKTAKYINTPSWVKETKTEESRYKIKGISPDIKRLIRQYRTIFYRYSSEPAYAKIIFENKSSIEIHYNDAEQIFAILKDEKEEIIKSSTKAKFFDFPLISTLPQIGPLNIEESIVLDETIKKAEMLSVTSMHFRNKIFNNREMLEKYNKLVQTNWRGLSIDSISAADDGNLTLLIRENDFTAEAGVMGHGLQMWLQMLWFIFTSTEATTLIVDEPDVYLHADLQKKLYKLLLQTKKQIILSSHSLEFILDTDPKNILIVQKDKPFSSYAASIPEVQKVISNIGYSSNLELIKFANAGKCLYVEGYDNKILACFAKTLNHDNFDEIPVFQLGGKTQWAKILGGSLIARKSTANAVKSYCILDKDYHSQESDNQKQEEAKENNITLFIWKSKEIENYLINPIVINRLVNPKDEVTTLKKIATLIEEIINNNKQIIVSKFGDQIQQTNKGLTYTSVTKLAEKIVNENWVTLEEKIQICPGKQILREIKDSIQDLYKISFSDIKLAKTFRKEEIHKDITTFFKEFYSK